MTEKLLGRAGNRSSQIEKFVVVFSVHPRALARIWVDLHTTPFVEDRIDGDVKPEHILVVYRWLNSYESEKELHTAFHFGEVSIGLWCRDITQKIAALRQLKVCIISLFQ